MTQKEREEIIPVLKKALQFYQDDFEIAGGCDHSVGICICQEINDAEHLRKLINRLESNTTRR